MASEKRKLLIGISQRVWALPVRGWEDDNALPIHRKVRFH